MKVHKFLSVLFTISLIILLAPGSLLTAYGASDGNDLKANVPITTIYEIDKDHNLLLNLSEITMEIYLASTDGEIIIEIPNIGGVTGVICKVDPTWLSCYNSGVTLIIPNGEFLHIDVEAWTSLAQQVQRDKTVTVPFTEESSLAGTLTN